MSVEAMAIVLHHSRAKGSDKLILLGIANHQGDGGAWPALSTLARYANVTEKSARASLRRLEALGELATHLMAGGRHDTPSWRRPNRYDVLVSCPVNCDRTMNHRPVRLPEAPADLWIDPPPLTGGGPVDGGGTPSRGRGANRPLEPDDNPRAASTTDRASDDAPGAGGPCSVCGKPEHECQRRYPISGHTYAPSRRTA